MWEPGPSFGLVDAETVEALVQVAGQSGGLPALVVQGEHPDAAGLAVARHLEDDGPRGCGGRAEHAEDVGNAVGRCGAEDGEREMEVLARHDAPGGDVLVLPAHDVVHDVVGKAQRAEEP